MEFIMEPVSSPGGEHFYNPHKAFLREDAESTKVHIVYDASAHESEKSPSLNECLEVGPPLQNKLWAVLVRIPFQLVALKGDIKQAFLQVRIREEDRDALLLHWISDLETWWVKVFTQALLGLAPSQSLLGGVIKQHLEIWQATFPRPIQQIETGCYRRLWTSLIQPSEVAFKCSRARVRQWVVKWRDCSLQNN